MTVVDLSVLVPTLGRELLGATLESLEACEPQPAEVLVLDQSEGLVSSKLTGGSSRPMMETIACRPPKGRALNEGLRRATHERVGIVDDDCTVRSDWAGVAYRAMLEYPQGMVTGQVLPGSDEPDAVPSTIRLNEPRDYTGTAHYAWLFGGNMVCSRGEVLAIGGFDEQIVPAPGVAGGEDCDLCYRWLRGGHRLRHVPELVVTHHGWRTHEDLSRLYVDYFRGQGMFYAKHLLQGDLRI